MPIQTKEYWKTTKFGSLRLEFPVDGLFTGSGLEVSWLCDCGKKTNSRVFRVTSGKTGTCGRCNELTADYFKTIKYGKLRMKDPISIHSGSNKKVEWICDCGKITCVPVHRVTSGLTVSCNACDLTILDPNTRYGSLKPEVALTVSLNSHRKTTWLCYCGNRTLARIEYVLSGRTKTCGKCNLLPESYWVTAKYGKLRMKNPTAMSKNANKKVIWMCNCGFESEATVSSVTNGHTSSCGRCHEAAATWFYANKDNIRSLKTPIHPEQIPPGWLSLNEPVLCTSRKTSVNCGACKKEYFPQWNGLRSGVSLTCGCASYRISRPQKEVSLFIESLGFKTQLEFEVNKLKYDIFVNESNILIEYNGSRWHSSEFSIIRDTRKIKNATMNGYECITILENDWLKNKELVKSALTEKLNLVKT